MHVGLKDDEFNRKPLFTLITKSIGEMIKRNKEKGQNEHKSFRERIGEMITG